MTISQSVAQGIQTTTLGVPSEVLKSAQSVVDNFLFKATDQSSADNQFHDNDLVNDFLSQDSSSSESSPLSPEQRSAIQQAGRGIEKAALGLGQLELGEELKLNALERSQQAAELAEQQALGAARLNAEIAEIQTTQKLNSATRQAEQSLGSLETQIANNALRGTSKSLQQVKNETIDIATDQLLQGQRQARQEQRNIMFSGAVKQVNAQRVQQQAEFKKEMVKFNTDLQKSKAIAGMVRSAGSAASTVALG